MNVKIFLVVMVVSSQPTAKSYVKTFEITPNPAGLEATWRDCQTWRVAKFHEYRAKIKGLGSYHVTASCFGNQVGG